MDNKLIAEHLSTLLASEEHSLMRHLHEAKPYVTPATFRIWRQIEKQVAAQAHDAEHLLELFNLLEESPRPGVFDQKVGFYHFTDLRTLMPEILLEKQRQVAIYEAAARAAAGHPAVGSALRAMVEDKRTQLAELESAGRELAASA
jgi:hypothetical protein